MPLKSTSKGRVTLAPPLLLTNFSLSVSDEVASELVVLNSLGITVALLLWIMLLAVNGYCFYRFCRKPIVERDLQT